jgi:hypothetical protein
LALRSENPASIPRPAGRAGPTSVSSAFGYPNDPLATPKSDGHVATFTFTAPAAGYANVTAHFGLRLRPTGANCHVQSLLAAAPTSTFGCDAAACVAPGYVDEIVSGTGRSLSLHHSTSRVFPVTAGNNTIYLNGASNGCDVRWGPITIDAVFVAENAGATLSFQ